jgi:hypothetical protein
MARSLPTHRSIQTHRHDRRCSSHPTFSTTNATVAQLPCLVKPIGFPVVLLSCFHFIPWRPVARTPTSSGPLP